MKILIRIYDAVHFFLNMLVVYYVLSILSILYAFVTFNPFNVQKSWAAMTCFFLNAKLKKIEGSQEPVRNEKALILVNHRSWSDFFIHDKMMDYTANFIARYLVAVAFPISLMISPYMKTLWYFNRDAPRKDFQKFYQWLDSKWALSKRNNLLVYPEGHRMFDSVKPAPMKKGMLIYAYERKLPIQIAICMGNENLIHEKKIKVNRGSEMSYFIDKPIKSTDFQTFEPFFQHVEKRFGEVFEKVHQTHYKKEK